MFFDNFQKGVRRRGERAVFALRQNNLPFDFRADQRNPQHAGPIAFFQCGSRQNGATNACSHQADGRCVVLHFIGPHQADALSGQLIVHEDPGRRHVADRDDVRPAHIRPTHCAATAERMGVTTEKHQGIIEQGNFKQIGVVFTLDANPQLRLAVQHGITNLIGTSVKQPNPVAGTLVGIFPDQERKQMTGHGWYAGQGKTTVDVLRHVFQLPKRAGHFINDVPGLWQKIPADRRQFDMACRAIQQLESQIAFQLLHPSRQRGLRQVQAFGCPVEASQFGDHHKRLYSVEIDLHPGVPHIFQKRNNRSIYCI